MADGLCAAASIFDKVIPMRLIALLILAVMAMVSSAADAQEPPLRVGRLAYAEGSVAVYHDPRDGWEKAYVNLPLTSENSIWTDPESRAEMRVSGTALRLDELTQLDIAVLDDDDLAAFVPQGSVSVRVRHFDNRHRLDFGTPHARFRFYGVGRYRVDVDPDREETLLTVFAGTASMRAVPSASSAAPTRPSCASARIPRRSTAGRLRATSAGSSGGPHATSPPT